MVSNQDILSAKILIVDDEEVSIEILTDILKKAGYSNITTTTNPVKATQLYQFIQPDLVLLDLHMPECDGFEVMAQLKVLQKGDYLPILIVSSDSDEDVKFNALESGAKDFLNKPFNRVEAEIRIRNLIEVRMLHNQLVGQNKELELKVADRTSELYDTQVDVIQRLSRAIEYRDSETGLHIIRMSHYSACLASKLGFTKKECEMVLAATPLHDIGKIGIPDNILLKPGKLTPPEWTIMKTHTTIGGELLDGSGSKLLTLAKEIALTHHERWDGLGYPNGLKEEKIPLIGRICGLCDVFDALTTKRVYKNAWPVEEAIEEINREDGSHFDPKVVKAFNEILSQILKIKNRYEDQLSRE